MLCNVIIPVRFGFWNNAFPKFHLVQKSFTWGTTKSVHWLLFFRNKSLKTSCLHGRRAVLFTLHLAYIINIKENKVCHVSVSSTPKPAGSLDLVFQNRPRDDRKQQKKNSHHVQYFQHFWNLSMLKLYSQNAALSMVAKLFIMAAILSRLFWRRIHVSYNLLKENPLFRIGFCRQFSVYRVKGFFGRSGRKVFALWFYMA